MRNAECGMRKERSEPCYLGCDEVSRSAFVVVVYGSHHGLIGIRTAQEPFMPAARKAPAATIRYTIASSIVAPVIPKMGQCAGLGNPAYKWGPMVHLEAACPTR